MKGLSADRLFFMSSAAFVAGYVLYMVMGYVWPIPMLSDELVAMMPVDPVMTPGTLPNMLSQLNWILSIGGVVTFVLGLIAWKS